MACRAGKAINDWFKGLVTSAINPVFNLLGTSLLATPRLDLLPRVSGLWAGSLAVANSCFVLLAVIGGLIVMGHQSVQTSYTVKDIAPRLVIAVVVANISLLLIGHAISFANGLSAALMGQGVNPEEAAGQLKKIIVHALNPADVGIFFVLVIMAAVLLGAVLAFIYIFRIMLTILLIAAAPLALACHALPHTENLAKMWWRAFAGVLAIQVAQALTFITAMKVALTSDMVTIFGVRTPGDQTDLWITLCLLYVLVRIPSWISRMVWQGGMGRSPIVRAAKTIAALIIFRGVLGNPAGSAAAGARSGMRHPPTPPGPPPSLPAPPPPPPPSSPSSPPVEPQPRWGRSDQRWMPPDPPWHERSHRGRPAPDSPAQQQRWGNPTATWIPPYAGDWRKPPPPPPRRPASSTPGRPPRPIRPWKPPA